MAFNWRPRSSNVYLPRQGYLTDAINKSYTQAFGTSRGVVGAPQFERPTTSAFVQGGRMGIHGGDFLTDTLMPLPARAIEAPLRPFNAATGGQLGRTINDVYQGVRDIPIVGNALKGVEGVVGVLDASNKASRAFLNFHMAAALKDSKNLAPNVTIMLGGERMTVGELREKVVRQWGVNEFTGQRYTFEELQQMAIDDQWGFGEFSTDENGFMGFLEQSVTDPINLLGIAAAPALAGIKAASWAKPTVSLVGRAANLPRVGAGAMMRLRGPQAVATSFGNATKYLEQFGNLGPGPATLGNVVDLARKIYFPQYGRFRAPRATQLTQAQRLNGVQTGLGLNRPTAALGSWMLGGAQQMAAFSAMEGAAGFLTQREYDDELGMAPAEQSGILDDIQDTFHAINNSHPLSENQTFMVLALFSPWMQSINVAQKAYRVGGRNPAAYYNQGVLHLSRRLGEMGADIKSEKDFLVWLGEGDEALGREIFEAYVDFTDVLLVENQFSPFATATLNSIEGKVQRAEFLTKELTDAVLSRRASGALGGRSLADNIIRFYREGFDTDPEQRLVRAERTITPEGLRYAMRRNYEASRALANEGLAHMGSLIVADGAPITRELIGALLTRLEAFDPQARIPREMAAIIIERHPSLIYQNDFWREFSYTLGQMQENVGKKDKALLPTEGVTVEQVRRNLEELIDEAPAESELYHEQMLRLERAHVKTKEAERVLTSPVPQSMPHVLSSMRQRFVTIGTHSANMSSKVRDIRKAEFFRNGKPRWESAKYLVGRFGNVFHRVDDKTFSKAPPKYELRHVKTNSYPKVTIDEWEIVTDDISGEQYYKHPYTGEVIDDTTFNNNYWDYVKDDDIRDDAPTIDSLADDERNYQMKFTDKDGGSKSFYAKDLYEVQIGDKEVYIFQPTSFDMYFANRAFDIPEPLFEREASGWYEMRDRFKINDTNLWFAARKDGNGTLLANQGFSTAKEAAEWVHSITDYHVEVKIDDGVIDISGKVSYPLRGRSGNEVRNTTPQYGPDGRLIINSHDDYVDFALSGLPDDPDGGTFATLERDILAGVRTDWTNSGKKRKPNTVTHRDGMPMNSSYVRGDRTYYFIGDDGLPHGSTRIEFDQDGIPAQVSLYVDPEYRGEKPYGRAMHMMYDQAFNDGIDLSKISGTSTTDAGSVATKRYWSTREDTLDTEALEIAILNGGRIIEVDVMPHLVRKIDPRSDMMLKQTDPVANEAYVARLAEFGLTPDDTDYGFSNFPEHPNMIANATVNDSGYHNYTMPWELLEKLDDGTIKRTEFKNFEDIQAHLATEEVIIQGGPKHADTLSRWGFEEVARYGDTYEMEVFKHGRRGNEPPSEMGYLYHFRPARGLERVKRHGLEPGISRPGEPAGVFFGDSVGSSRQLAPPGMTKDSMLLRVREDQVDTVVGLHNDLVYDKGNLSPDLLEYWGTDGQWHPLSKMERVVYAYRGGDVTKAALNSRIKGATREYKPTNRRTKTRAAALNIARKRANDASIAYPSLETLGPGYTNSRKFFSADERRKQLNELSRELDEKARSSAESVQYVDDTLAVIADLDKVTDIDHWWDSATPEEVARLTDQVKLLNKEYPGLQIHDGGIFIDPRQERFGHLLTGYSTMARHVFDYGFLSPISRFYDTLFTPKHSRALQREVMHELNVQLGIIGLNPKQRERFLEGVRERVAESRSARGVGSMVGLHTSRNIRALNETQLQGALKEAAGQEFVDTVLSRYGSVQKMVTEAANGLMRRSAERARMGGKVSPLEAAANAAYRVYQFGDGIEHVSDATHRISKFWYPLLRFTADPMFMMMNLIEPYIYGITRNGVQKMRHSRTQAQAGINKRAIDRASRHSVPAGGFADVENLPIETLMTDAGVFTIPRNMRSSLEAEHQIGRMESYVNVLQDIPKSDPLAQLFQERFGTADPKQWAQQMDELMYGWLNDGPEATVMQSFRELTEEFGFTQQDIQMMSPFMQRLSEMHRALYDDLADLYIGRLNRAGIERVLDNFWLLWPLSYTIKATKWIASIMFYKIGGVRTGPLGAIMYDEYRQRFLRAVENDPELQEWLDDNQDFIFLFEMFLPMSPESIGVSLNKPVRIAGSWLNANTLDDEGIRNAIGDYSYIEDVPEAIGTAGRWGPVRSWNLFTRLMRNMQVPGWQTGEGSGGGIDNYSPTR